MEQIEKIFEVACTLIDVMACLSATGLRSSGFKLGPQDHLKHFVTLVNELPGGRARFLPLLLTKISQTVPALIDPITNDLNLRPNLSGPNSGGLVESSFLHFPGQPSDEITPESTLGDWSHGNFNYAEMSRIGDKTPEADDVFLHYSGVLA